MIHRIHRKHSIVVTMIRWVVCGIYIYIALTWIIDSLRPMIIHHVDALTGTLILSQPLDPI